ncbi:MAG TPA: tripartite tricarboxylate transporter substrate binding protein [Gemmatimonadales bacterium]|nr:tripartite tricarboxylate transporter substrate binding protein [Gemmatimonadales bacterium]
MIARRRLLALLPAALSYPSVLGAQSAATSWPTRPVRYIELFAAGTGVDIASRTWCAAMAEVTGQQFVVDNRVGAGGVIGTTAIVRAPPDGYTIGLSGIGQLAIAPTLYARLPIDVSRDMALISGLWRQSLLLLANNDLPVRDVAELIALLRREPVRHLYGHGGQGTSLHLAMELFKARAGVDIGAVAYTGGRIQLDLIAGRVQLLCLLFSGGIAGVRDGKFRALAVMSPERSPFAPDIPAMGEYLPGFDVSSWAVIAGPAGLQPALVERMHRLSLQALARPELVQRYHQAGNTPWPAGPEELAAYRIQQEALLAPIIRASGARIE